MFKKKNKEEILDLELDFVTEDPYIDYIKYKNCFYFIKKRTAVIIGDKKWDDKLNAMISVPKFHIFIEKVIKIKEEYTPLIKKQLYYEIRCPEPFAVIKNLKGN